MTDFSLALCASAVGSMRSRSGALALAQPEESDSRIVMENSARVWRCDAKRTFVLALAVSVKPVVKTPAHVCLFFYAVVETCAQPRHPPPTLAYTLPTDHIRSLHTL